MQLFPNPATNQLTTAAPVKITELSIYSIMGKVVYARDHNDKSANVDVSNLAAGIYFVKINGTVVRKFVKE